MTKGKNDGGKAAEALLAAIWRDIELLSDVAVRAAHTASAKRLRTAKILQQANRIGALATALGMVTERSAPARRRRAIT